MIERKKDMTRGVVELRIPDTIDDEDMDGEWYYIL